MKQISLRSVWLLLLGFYSGLPLVAIGSTLKARLTEEGVSLATIGFFSSITLPYAVKFLWAPMFDRFKLPFLKRRTGWLIVCGAGVSLSLLALSASVDVRAVCLFAFCCSFTSASFDIVVDAYRREALASNELGLGTAFFVNGYRVGMLISGAGALALADHIPWQQVYQILSAVMGSSILILLLLPETFEVPNQAKGFLVAYVEPLKEFFQRDGWALILLFILLYKIGDSLAGELTMPMYLSLGFAKTDIALVVKGYGLAASLIGAFIGGLVLLRMNVWRALYLFGIFQIVSVLSFVMLPLSDHPTKELLAFVIGFENVASGMGTAAFTALLARLTNRAFSATQYALLSSLIGIPRAFLGAPSGIFVEYFGYVWFFWACAVFAVPGILLIPKLHKKVLLLH